jgi:hypothetical protein
MFVAPLPVTTRRASGGSALVIVLFFVILLTAITIAFLSRSLMAVKISSSSSNETKAGILAASAGDIVIGDLKQEIIAGSISAGTINWPVYNPSSNATMIPFQNGVPTSGTLIPNMISRSVRPGNTGGAAPYIPYPAAYTATTIPPNRTADDTGTPANVNSVTPSLNGRFISLSQWNSHYLIPRNTSITPGSTSTDSTPASSFVAPDWVIMTRKGANSVSWNANLSDPTPTNTGYAVGRYAYAVYNEGGLLDMNAAGYPADASTPGGPNGLTAAQIGRKGSLALADLTQLTAGTVSMTQTQVNNFVGWRNYASAQLSAANGSYNAFSFTSGTASNWLTNFVTGNTNGYMNIVNPAGVTTPPTDQALLSRQQLITLIQSLNVSPDFLQYMGTFSRGLEQPSTVPDPNRPTILAGTLPAQAAVDSYLGNNDAVGHDNSVNPAFLSIRVTAAFQRFNGTQAVVGEPLVKTKFPLSRLAMVAYNAINTTAEVGTNSLYNGTYNADPIYDYFGLERTSTANAWTYDHGLSGTIMTLSQVAGQNREPDFAELLKAAIAAGSVAKGGPNLHNNGENYEYTNDTISDVQILQIMANLIDQQDNDSYPTSLQLKYTPPTGTFYFIPIYGIEDLPYFYRYHLFSVVDTLPAPSLSITTPQMSFDPVPAGITTKATISTAIQYTTGSTVPGTWNMSTTGTATFSSPVEKGTPLTITGYATYFYVPAVWNPHDPNTRATSTNNRPLKYRIYATTLDPAGLTTAWLIGAESNMTGSNDVAVNLTASPPVTVPTSSISKVFPETDGAAVPTYYWPVSKPATFTAPAAFNSIGPNIMTFTDAAGALFREPTMLWRPSNPTGINLTGSSVVDANTSKTYYGIVAGRAPTSAQVTFASTSTATGASMPQHNDGLYVFQGVNLGITTYLPSGSWQQITFFLQYQDPNNASNWITYDTKYPDLHGMSNPNLIINTVDYTNKTYQNPLLNGQLQGTATSMDPRSARWGVGTAAQLGNVPGSGITPAYVLEKTANASFPSPTSNSANSSMGSSLFTVMETDRPRADGGDQVFYSNPAATSDPPTGGLRNVQMRWFSPGEYRAGSGTATSPREFDGLFSQNNPALQSSLFGQNNATADSLYYEDPDGVARRGMASYNTSINDSNNTSNSSSLASPSTARTGLPLATASSYADNTGVGVPTTQSQSRPMILNRPFRSVAEMSYAFRGTPWKNIDFFNPESGDSALLDTFCVNETPPTALVAGKVDLNTRQIPVLQALIAGTSPDEIYNVSSALPATYSASVASALPPLTSTQAKNIATTLTTITGDKTHAWRGPLQNVSALVGRYVSSPGTTTDTDLYTFTPNSPITGQKTSVTYAGLSAALDTASFNGAANNAFGTANPSYALIQRFRESALRPLADAGQVRVWNLLIDLVVQTGKYPRNSANLSQFNVDGQKRVWIHVAIDRYTGQVLDKQVEVVTP